MNLNDAQDTLDDLLECPTTETSPNLHHFEHGPPRTPHIRTDCFILFDPVSNHTFYYTLTPY